MDILRSLLLIALLVLIWNLRFGTARPVRDFLEWGRSHVFLFLVNAVMIGIVWGFIGREYGLQGLFLQDNAVLEFLAGMMVMLLFLRMDLQHFVLDESEANWTRSVERSVDFLLGTAAWLGHEIEVQRWLRDGFLEHLSNVDLNTIRCRLRRQRRNKQSSQVADLVQCERFRLLFSPAVLLVSALVLLPILGLIPAIGIPLAAGENFINLASHLPWLLGTSVGTFAGVWLASWSARRLDAARMRVRQLRNSALASGWSHTRHRMLETIKQDTAALSSTADDSPELHGSWSVDAESRRRLLASFLLMFFVVHALAPWLAPRLGALSYFEPLPGEGIQIWWPLTVLIGETLLAVVALVAWILLIRAPLARLLRNMAMAGYKLAVAATPLERRLEIDWRARLLLLYVPIALILFVVSYVTLQRGESAWRGAGAALLVLLFLGALSTTFSLGTSLQLLERAELRRSWLMAIQLVLLAFAIGCWQAEWYRTSLVMSVGTFVWLAVPLVACWRRTAIQSSVVPTATVAVVGGLAAYVAVPALNDWLPAGVGLVIGTNVVLLGGAAMRQVVHSKRPLHLYCLSAIIGFFAFALVYNGLPEVAKSLLPASISIVCLFGVIASLYTLFAVTWRARTAMVVMATCALLLIANGNAWFRTPNQFKLSFPGLESYYRAPAVLLNSESYFRDTMPSVVKLYYAEAGSREASDLSHVNLERLASAELSLADVASNAEGLDLTIREFAGHLRPRNGDPLRAIKTNDYQPVTLERGADGLQTVVVPLTTFLQSQIYSEFHDMTLQFMRAGAPIGTSVRLSAREPREQHGKVEPILDIEDVYAARPNATWSADWKFDPVTSRLILSGLPRGAVPRGAEQVTISTRWNGVVLPRSSWPKDGFRIRLQLLRNVPPLKQEQLDELRRYLTNCYLVHQRPRVAVHDDVDTDLRTFPQLQSGDCVILEDIAPESPIILGTFLIGSSESASGRLNRRLLTSECVGRTLAENRSQTAIGGLRPKYQLRVVYDRGIFAVHGQSSPSQGHVVAIYNGDRVRSGDRLVLHWPQGDLGSREAGGVFRVSRVIAPQTEPAEGLPRGYWLAELIAEDGATPLPEDMGDPVVGEWQVLRPLDNYESLQWWQRNVGKQWSTAAVAAGDALPEHASQVKPPLVIVTVSGGGIRASVWTATVLCKLEEELGPAFPQHVRLITGASGGMVGGTYYAGTMDVHSSEEAARSGVRLEDIVARMASDQLDAVIGQFIFSDVPGALNPIPHASDRGKVLESTWKRLAPGADGSASPFDRRVQSYAADELLGCRPSMVYTPMMVEDGRRLLISNLDLSFVARNLGGMLLEPESRKINHLAYFEDKSDREILLKDDVISLSAVEFFRIFPDARDFRMSTAMRMSASFPWISPAVSLPTSPPRRVVDAAYYDNYGVNMAAMWLTELRDWLVARTSGVVVIQIRDHISQTARTNLDFDREADDAVQGLLDNLTWQANRRVVGPGSQAITTPLSGISSARQWTMSYRNDEQVELLDELFGDAAGSEFFRTVVFECPIEASLSWNLSIAERKMIENGFGQPNRIKDYFGADAAEQARWDDENRSAADYPQRLKARFDDQLRKIGFAPKHQGQVKTSEELYKNVMNNRKRLVLLKDWWESKRKPIAAQ